MTRTASSGRLWAPRRITCRVSLEGFEPAHVPYPRRILPPSSLPVWPLPPPDLSPPNLPPNADQPPTVNIPLPTRQPPTDYLEYYSNHMAGAIRQHVDEMHNCEDLAMALLVGATTRRPPAFLHSARVVDLGKGLLKVKGISSGNKHGDVSGGAAASSGRRGGAEAWVVEVRGAAVGARVGNYSHYSM